MGELMKKNCQMETAESFANFAIGVKVDILKTTWKDAVKFRFIIVRSIIQLTCT